MPALSLRSALCIGLVVSGFATARAAPTYTVSLDDPSGTHAASYQEIATDVQAAGAAWATAFGDYGNATIGIEVGFDPALPTEEGASTSSRLVGQDPRSGVPVYEQGAAAKLKGGAPHTPGIDGRITIGDGFFSALWFDPSPAAGTDPVPAGKITASSFTSSGTPSPSTAGGTARRVRSARTTNRRSTDGWSRRMATCSSKGRTRRRSMAGRCR